ncbi:MAG: hypothetical protein M0R23_08425 [Bacteroidales bacterium]|nr:hypothetical protein [Bacteroidales bacterium]
MDIENIRKEALDNLEQIKNKEDLDLFKKDYLGKKEKIREFFSLIKDLPIEEKKTLGQKINQLASEIEEIFLSKPTELGNLHPITQVRREMERIFQFEGHPAKNVLSLEKTFYF